MTMLEERQAALERENSELRRQLDVCHAELKEAREQQTATAEVLQVINSSPGDLAPVFDAILEKAHRLCGVAYGSLNFSTATTFAPSPPIRFPEPFAEAVAPAATSGADTGDRFLIEGERTVHIPDLWQELVSTTRSIAPQPMRSSGRMRTVLLCRRCARKAELLGL